MLKISFTPYKICCNETFLRWNERYFLEQRKQTPHFFTSPGTMPYPSLKHFVK